MTLEDVRALVLAADEDALHYRHRRGCGPYTTWRETQRIRRNADDAPELGWAFTIDRFAQEEFDEVAARIERVLLEAQGVAYRYVVDYERDSGYIHHIFDCEGI